MWRYWHQSSCDLSTWDILLLKSTENRSRFVKMCWIWESELIIDIDSTRYGTKNRSLWTVRVAFWEIILQSECGHANKCRSNILLRRSFTGIKDTWLVTDSSQWRILKSFWGKALEMTRGLLSILILRYLVESVLVRVFELMKGGSNGQGARETERQKSKEWVKLYDVLRFKSACKKKS